MSESTDEKKKPYEKPQLRTIEMKEEEVLAVGCKTAGAPLPGVNQPVGCGIGSGCSSEGS